MNHDLDPDDKGTLKINKDEAELVNLIYQTYIETGSLLKTAILMNEKGFRTKEYFSRRGNFHNGKPFGKTQISRLIQSPVYIGKVTHHGNVFDGKHEGIVSEEIFEKANKMLESNRKSHNSQKAVVQHTFLLKGLLKCGYCGAFMTPKYCLGKTRKMYYYYQCTGNAHSGKQRCSMKYVPATEIEDKVVEEVKKIAERLDLIEEVAEEANKEGMARIQEMKGQKKALENKLPGFQDEIAKCMKWLKIRDPDEGDNLILGEKIIADLTAAGKQEKQILEEVERLDLQVREFEQKALDTEVAKDALVKFSELYELASEEQKATLMQLLIAKIVFHPDEIKIGVYGDLDEKVLLTSKEDGCATSNKWLPRGMSQSVLLWDALQIEMEKIERGHTTIKFMRKHNHVKESVLNMVR